MEVEFSSQLGCKYGFGESEFGSEADAPLELAYALTIRLGQHLEAVVQALLTPIQRRRVQLARDTVYVICTIEAAPT
ncbi:MAG: hypothetical protein ACLQBA_21315 [Candidatus Binataceae bacterium]